MCEIDLKDPAYLARLPKDVLVKLVLETTEKADCFQSQITQLNKQVLALEEEIANLKEIKKLRSHDKFVSSSEQMEFLFDEAEVINAPVSEEEKKEEEIEVKAHKRKIRRRTCQAPSDAPVIEIDHTEGAPCEIVKDGVTMVRDGVEIIDKISRIPAKLIVERNIYPKYRAKDTSGDKRGDNVEVLFPAGDVDRIAASPAFISSIAMSKYDDHLPLYRQEEIFERMGVYVSRQKMAGWLIKYYEALMPLDKLIKDRVYRSPYLNLDETTVTVLNVKDKNGKVSRNSFVYLAIGSEYDNTRRDVHALVHCEYHQGRKVDDIMENLR